MAEMIQLDTHAARDRRSLVTPEGVDLSLGLATAGQRIGAFAIDVMVIIAALGVINLVVYMMVRIAVSGGVGGGKATMDIAAAIWLLASFFVRNGYFILMEGGRRGATIGKRVAGLRVVGRAGERLSLESVIARNLMREVEVFLPLIFAVSLIGDRGATWLTMLGGLWVMVFLLFPLFNRDRLRVGDLLAGTWVVSIPKRQLTWDLAHQHRPSMAFTAEQLDAYGVYELQTLEKVLREGQWETMQMVASTIRHKIGQWDDVGDHDFLTAYYAAARAHMERGLLFGKRRAHKFDR